MDNILAKDEFFDGLINRRQIRFFNTASLISRGVEAEASYRDVAGNLGYANAALAFTAATASATTPSKNPLLDEDVDAGNCDVTENSPALVLQTGVSTKLLFDLLHASGRAFISARRTQDPTRRSTRTWA